MSKQIEEVMELVDALQWEAESCIVSHGSLKKVDEIRTAIESKLRELLPVWLPIESAPADQWVLVEYADGEVSKAMCTDAWWTDWDGDFYGFPIRWMPLPNPQE